jgi:biotin carboxylase
MLNYETYYLVSGLITSLLNSFHSEEAVIVVNPFSTGAHVAEELSKRTYKVIALWTKAITKAQRKSRVDFRAFASVEEGTGLEETLAAVKDAAKNFRIVACICGGAEGAVLTDAMSELLGVRTNGTEIKNRGNKKVQQEIIKEAGLRSIRQATGQNIADVHEFLISEKYPVVVKPSEFVGPEGVKLCYSMEEAQNHFNSLVTLLKTSGKDAFVICQEYLKGKEYIIDHVSRDGLHKTTSKLLGES